MLAVFAMESSLLGLYREKVCYECAMGFSREGKLKLHNYQ